MGNTTGQACAFLELGGEGRTDKTLMMMLGSDRGECWEADLVTWG